MLAVCQECIVCIDPMHLSAFSVADHRYPVCFCNHQMQTNSCATELYHAKNTVVAASHLLYLYTLSTHTYMVAANVRMHHEGCIVFGTRIYPCSLHITFGLSRKKHAGIVDTVLYLIVDRCMRLAQGQSTGWWLPEALRQLACRRVTSIFAFAHAGA